ncbi:alpha/beta fold hydrolase [Subtercola frigoramans]|uniref:Cation diffusion facilitator CzcD-associated flavoprotein CzcO/pimeloyl-ACP methyl ester carboxylesterase n=1 Tax=Subtercola frigoramans TaxID=120298 RepID=A0ABS2L350_9MICO|nr:alpha/beta fold hydrolase [Subtercola frigoramans]MBM7471444.1 cation diffusion facilitator CzcD-associated flavoprotein CzcO/pimeloyl-ACP methyl ester carboxylesterase [Subtercola frigoramans]
MTEHVDVLIVGAGLSGIGAASHLKRDCPGKSFVILESRGTVGGTWDLFRYPGIRSDSDMYTLGYSFRPWTDAKAIADGDSIRDYINDTIADEGLSSRLRLNHRVISAEWSSETALWTVTALRTSNAEYQADVPDARLTETVTFTCSFLSVCSGYYRYDEGFTPTIPGADSFGGTIVHPQHWPADLDYAGKRVVVVGSGATAVTLVPSLAKTAEHVTMLQRSPTYIAPVPLRDHFADRLRGKLPAQLAYTLVRVKNIGYSMFTYQLSRRRPETMKAILRKSAVAKLPAGFDVDTHLAPSYEPWDQRLCAIPNGDLYRAISAGNADIVTDRIEKITPTGIDLVSGATLDADIIVTATGLNLLVMGGMNLTVDGRPVDVSKSLTYKGMMLAGVPNFSLTIGYTNASWTLKADLVARYVCRLLRYLDRHGYDFVTPKAPAAVTAGDLVPLIDLQAGYILRDVDALPKQGEKSPWRLHQNYVRDFRLLRAGRITDDVRFGRRGERASTGLTESALDLPGTAMITVNGTRLRYRETGDANNSPILLIHGIGQSLDDFTEQHALLEDRYRVISLDLPGFAYSARLPGTATLDKLASILPGFLDTLGIAEPVPVVGNSLGGAVAMTFAVANPERVSALVLADSAGFGPEVTMVLRMLAVKPLATLLMRPNAQNSARTVQSLFYDKSLATDARIAHAFAISRRRSHAATTLDLAHDLGTLRGVRPEWRQSLVAGVRRLDIPTLVVWGDHDHVLPFIHLAAAAEALPKAETHVFDNTGHMPQIERADEFAVLLHDFLSRRLSARDAFALPAR